LAYKWVCVFGNILKTTCFRIQLCLDNLHFVEMVQCHQSWPVNQVGVLGWPSPSFARAANYVKRNCGPLTISGPMLRLFRMDSTCRGNQMQGTGSENAIKRWLTSRICNGSWLRRVGVLNPHVSDVDNGEHPWPSTCETTCALHAEIMWYREASWSQKEPASMESYALPTTHWCTHGRRRPAIHNTYM